MDRSKAERLPSAWGHKCLSSMGRPLRPALGNTRPLEALPVPTTEGPAGTRASCPLLPSLLSQHPWHLLRVQCICGVQAGPSPRTLPARVLHASAVALSPEPAQSWRRTAGAWAGCAGASAAGPAQERPSTCHLCLVENSILFHLARQKKQKASWAIMWVSSTSSPRVAKMGLVLTQAATGGRLCLVLKRQASPPGPFSQCVHS